MSSTRLLEKRIKDTLTNASSRVEASEQLSYRVNNAIKQQTKKEDSIIMKKRFTFKSAIIMAAVLCLTTVTVFAATSISGYITKSSPNAPSTTFPTQESLQKDLGFVPKTVETFSNGYTFKDVEIGGISAVGKDGKKMGDYKSASFRYANQGKQVTLDINEKLPDDTAGSNSVKTDYKGFALCYTSQKNKFVPENYKMTEEDKKAQQSGEIMFAYGADTVETSTVQKVIWFNNGITYGLMAMDSNLTQADLTAMAKEIVDKSK